MANSIEIFNSKFKKENLIGENNFFNNSSELNEYNKLQQKYISSVDYSSPNNFARFGSAVEYYKNVIDYIDSDYPYDGSTKEKLSWINSLNEFEYYIFNNEFPRASGYVNLSSSQYINIYSYLDEQEDNSKNTYNTNTLYRSNTLLSLENGFTFEAWLNFDNSTDNSTIINITAITSSGGNLSTIDLLTLNRVTSSYSHFELTDGLSTYQFTSSIPDNSWHHYAFYIKSGSMSLSIDGQLTEQIDGISIVPNVNELIFVPLGLMLLPVYQSSPIVGEFNKSSVFKIGGGSKFSIDEARFWNGKRTVEKIGRYWFTNIDGNDFEDIDNSNLIFYYKFNEGWDTQYQFLCLDYSGRQNDGEIIGYNVDCRSTGSAIDTSDLTQDPEKKEIIFGGLRYSSEVQNFLEQKILTGSNHDENNIHMLYNKFPGWLLEDEEENNTKHLKQLIQIVSSYFDDLYNKIYEISNHKHAKYSDLKENIYPFYNKILTSMGFDVTDLFSNLDIIEKVSSRNDVTIFDEDLDKIKNSIFQNIYYNLSYILKSKGTEKSIKSFLKSYGINDNLVKINLYADKTVYNSVNRVKETTVKKKTITMTGSNSIYLSSDPISEDSSLNHYTLEVSTIFPKKQTPEASLTSSLFGIQNNNLTDYDWASNNYHYYVLIENNLELGDRIVFSDGTNYSSSTYYSNLYDDTVWNFAIRKKPNYDTLFGVSTPSDYTIELYAVNKNSHESLEFSCSLPFNNSNGYLRHYIGSRKTDLTGSSIHQSNSKFLYCNFWSDYLNNDVIISHNKDILSYGVDE